MADIAVAAAEFLGVVVRGLHRLPLVLLVAAGVVLVAALAVALPAVLSVAVAARIRLVARQFVFRLTLLASGGR